MRISYKKVVLFMFLATSIITAQEKLKGNKIVTIENRNISDFTEVEIINDIDVFLVYNENQSVEIETDSNLQNAIITEINNNVLTIRTNEVIGRNKALNLHLKVNKKLQEINAYNKVKVHSKNSLTIDYLTINAYDNSSFDLKLNSKSVQINGKNDSDLSFQILSDDVVVMIEQSCKLEATIDTKEIHITNIDKSTFAIIGSTDHLEMEASGDTSFKGKDFKIVNATVKANNSANLYINVSEILELYSNNTSEVHLYSDPKININEFYDKSLLRKRELD